MPKISWTLFLTSWRRILSIVISMKDSISSINFRNVHICESFSFFMFFHSKSLSLIEWTLTILRRINSRIFIKKWKFERILFYVRIIFYENVFHFVFHFVFHSFFHNVHIFDFMSFRFCLIFHSLALDDQRINLLICFFQTNDATIFDLRIDVSSVVKSFFVIVHCLYLSFNSNVWRISKEFIFDFFLHHDESFCTIHDQRCLITITTINSLESK